MTKPIENREPIVPFLFVSLGRARCCDCVTLRSVRRRPFRVWPEQGWVTHARRFWHSAALHPAACSRFGK